MKYIKSFERMYKDSDGQTKQSLTKKTVDYNKIYTMDCNDEILCVGKMIDHPRDTGCIIEGYDITGNKAYIPIKYGKWQWIRESTPEEIEIFKIFNQSIKFNI